MIHALEIAVRADGPVDGAGMDAQHVFQFVHQLEGILGRAVHLVYKGEDGNAAHPANLEQLDRLLLHALGGVDEHHSAVGRHQHAVGILAEILMAGGIQNVDVKAIEGELHGAAGNRNAALLFNLHPVAGCMALSLARLDRPRLTDCAAVQQQLFSQRGFTGVRVADNGERSSAGDFVLKHNLSPSCGLCHDRIL